MSFFDKAMATTYDERNRRLAPIGDAMQLLVRLVLHRLRPDASVLCVGAGTGAEVLSLAVAYPGWSFVAVDPSAAMLEVCADRLQAAGLSARCRLVCGHARDLPEDERFDAATAILVGHFVPHAERLAFYRSLTDRLVDGGWLVDTEIATDLDAPEFPSVLRDWEQVQGLLGADATALAAIPATLRERLAVCSPARVEELLRESGIAAPIRFFQASLISGWYGRKGRPG